MRYLLSILILSSTVFAADSPVTFNKDVLPILQRECQVCHRPGEIGSDAVSHLRRHAALGQGDKGSGLSKKMPPWFADPKYGHFTNERHLSEAEIATLACVGQQRSPGGRRQR
jgi:mono/diheme cytochrome c family protein